MLAITIKSFGYTQWETGLLYTIAPIVYTLSSPFVHLLSKYLHKRGIILFGLIMANFSLLMIGGADFPFQFNNQPQFIFIGLFMIGTAVASVAIPALPEMFEAYEINKELSDIYDKE